MVGNGEMHAATLGPNVRYVRIEWPDGAEAVKLSLVNKASFGKVPTFDGTILDSSERPVIREVVDQAGGLVGFAYTAELSEEDFGFHLMEEYGFGEIVFA